MRDDGEDAGAFAGNGPAAPASALLDPELRLQHGRDIAWKALNRRDRTEAELRHLLAGKRVEPAVIETVIAELLEQGYVDDAGYAQRFAEDRRNLDGWGADRIARRLGTLGIARAHIDAALAAQDRDDELAAALALLARRVPAPPSTPRERDRALALLVRRGYALELAHDALRRYGGVAIEHGL